MRKWIAHWEIWLECVLAAVLLMALYLIFHNLAPIWEQISHFLRVVRPFLIGFAIAYVLGVPARTFQRWFARCGKKAARILSVLLSYVLALLFVGFFLGVALPVLITNLWEFATQLPTYIDAILLGLGGSQAVVDYFNETVTGVVGDLSTMQELFSRVGSGLTSIGSYAKIMTEGVFDLFLGIVVSVYMLLYKERLLRLLDRLLRLVLKERPLATLKSGVHQANEIFYKFMACKLIAGTILGTISGVVLSLLGVEYALMLGLIIGLCNLVPYIGAIISFILTVTVSAFTGGAMTALLAGIFLLLLQQVDDTIIQPRLIGEALDLNPVLIIFAITVGGAYFNVGGMILAVPLMAIIKTFLSRQANRS